MPVILVSSRLALANLCPKRSWLIAAGQVALMSSLFFGLAVLVAVVRFGSFESGRAYLGGSRVFVENPILNTTYDPSSEQVSIRYELKNLENAPVAILGSNASCSCTLLEDLPSSIPARNSIIVSAIVRIDPNKSANGIE